MVSAAVHPDNFTACEFDGEDRYQCIKSTTFHLIG
jgi:hypothetical protein